MSIVIIAIRSSVESNIDTKGLLERMCAVAVSVILRELESDGSLIALQIFERRVIFVRLDMILKLIGGLWGCSHLFFHLLKLDVANLVWKKPEWNIQHVVKSLIPVIETMVLSHEAAFLRNIVELLHMWTPN